MRFGGLGVGAAVMLAGLVIAGAGHGYPAHEVRLLSGAAWLASSRVGQVTLLDGVSADVAAQMQVAPPGHAIDVIQQGANAYVVDHTAGTMRRVDGATFDLTAPATPIPDAHAGLTGYADADAVHALDTDRGILVTADPHTLTPTGPPVSLAAHLSRDSSIVDDSGRLWVVDDSTGDVLGISGGARIVGHGVARPGHALLTSVGGHPVVVDPVARKAITIDPDTGTAAASQDLDLRSDDTLAVSGSPHGNRLYVVLSRGVLDICDLSASVCDTVVALDGNHDDLGPAVEAGGRLFVPDYSTGQVWVVDLDRHAVVATAEVLTPAARFQLLNRDGVVFFNDPDSERAGVVSITGVVTRVAKYDPGAANKAGAAPAVPGTTAAAPPPARDRRPVTTTPPAIPSSPVTVPRRPSPSPPPTTTPAVHLAVTLSTTTPTVGQDATLQVRTDTGPPSTAHWTFGDGQAADGATVTHRWATAGTYQVSVQATTADGRQATTSVTVTVVDASAKVTLTVVITAPSFGGHNRVFGYNNAQALNCPGTCTITVDKGTQIDIGAVPDYAMSEDLGSWNCPGTVEGAAGTRVCAGITLNQDFTLDVTFVFHALSYMSGSWQNSKPADGNVTHAQITELSQTEATVDVTVTTGCPATTPCDWGPAPATLADDGTLTAVYHNSGGTETLTFTADPTAGELAIRDHVVYLGGSLTYDDTMVR